LAHVVTVAVASAQLAPQLKRGPFEVIADGERIAERGGNWFTRRFGAGYPDLDTVVEQLEKHRDRDAAS
jgi:hypothetical protein